MRYMEYQIHFGRKFYLDKLKGYWISTDYPRIRAHRWVWMNTHGVIPKGFHIHHKDEDKSNNIISNLQLVHCARHLSMHASTPENKKRVKELVDTIRPLTKHWHASPEGKAWHKFHAIKCKFGKNAPVDYICELCSSPFKSSKLNRTRFCSNACKSKWRRNAGIDDVDRICERCEKIFRINKYSKQRYCAKTCLSTLRSSLDKEAFELSSRGKTYQEVADELNIDRKLAASLVKQWSEKLNIPTLVR